MRQKHQQAVDQIAEGADPLVKAAKERDTSLASLKSALDAGAISEERYKTVVGAVNDQYDTAVDRVNKRNNALTVEERAINSVTDSYSNLLLQVEHAQLATEAFAQGAFTKIDVRANERVVDFLTSFAKQAKISGASL